MPIKCAFCRRKYAQTGPYEKHLRTEHANLDIVLASTVRYTNSNAETELLHHEGQEGIDSDYESEPEPTGCELDPYTDNIAHESDTEILGDSTSSLPARQEHFERAWGMQLGMSMDLSVNTTICATTHGHHSPVRPVSNWRLGSFRLKYLSHKSTNTS